jgi:hypothetical protein
MIILIFSIKIFKLKIEFEKRKNSILNLLHFLVIFKMKKLNSIIFVSI